MGASRKANFAPPARGYTGVGSGRTANIANRPAAELGNWSTTYTNSYEVCCRQHDAFATALVARFMYTVDYLLACIMLYCTCCWVS